MFSLLDLTNILINTYTKRKLLKNTLKRAIQVFCLGCLIWQADTCYEKFASKPTGAYLSLTNTKQIALSFTAAF